VEEEFEAVGGGHERDGQRADQDPVPTRKRNKHKLGYIKKYNGMLLSIIKLRLLKKRGRRWRPREGRAASRPGSST